MIPEDKPLSEKLQEYHKAISSEFASNEPNDPVAIAKAKLTDLLSTATRALEQLLIAAESDAVRMSGIKLVFDYTLGKPGVPTGEDELTKLIASLTSKKEVSKSEGKGQTPKST